VNDNTSTTQGRGNGDGHEGGDGEKEKMVVVDWYGPDDPENPQNWYVDPILQRRQHQSIVNNSMTGNEKRI